MYVLSMADWLSLEEVELVKITITSAECFEGVAAEINRFDEPPRELIEVIEACARLFFRSDARMILQDCV